VVFVANGGDHEFTGAAAVEFEGKVTGAVGSNTRTGFAAHHADGNIREGQAGFGIGDLSLDGILGPCTEVKKEKQEQKGLELSHSKRFIVIYPNWSTNNWLTKYCIYPLHFQIKIG
jgi:hypothetical protein